MTIRLRFGGTISDVFSTGATMLQEGGTYSSPDHVYFHGNYTATGGLLDAGDAIVGEGGTPSSSGVLNIDGGELRFSGPMTIRYWLPLGLTSVNLSGGKLSVGQLIDQSPNWSSFHWTGGELAFTNAPTLTLGTGTLFGPTLELISSGRTGFSTNSALQVPSGSSITLNGGATLTVGTLRLNAGALLTHHNGTANLGGAEIGSGVGNATYNFYGGTINTTGGGVFVGNSGAGTFNHTNGAYVGVGYNTLVVGQNGTYNMSGGTLTTTSYDPAYFTEIVATSALFSQSGGTHNAARIILNDGGTYNLSNGTLNLTDQSGGYYVLMVGHTGSGSFVQTGGVNNVMVRGWGLVMAWGSPTGTGSYTLFDGDLNASEENVGMDGVAVFTQYGGRNTTTPVGFTSGSLILGRNAGSHGTYNLHGGSLSVSNANNGPIAELIGGNGTGVFTQHNGTHNATSLVVGYGTGTGTFTLLGGTVAVSGNEDAGKLGHGTIIQSGGTNTISNTLYVGTEVGGTGVFSLSGTGTLTATRDYVGFRGTGTFTQTGGTNSTTSFISMGELAGSTGIYTLSGTGSINAGELDAGWSGSGTFTQLGGTNTVQGPVRVANNPGSKGLFSLQGGVLSAASVTIKAGTLPTNGGTFEILGTFPATTMTAQSITNSGVLRVNGDGLRSGPSGPTFTQTATGTLNIEIGGYATGEYGRLATTQAALAGTLNVALADGYTPADGDSFDIITGPVSGTFATVSLPGCGWHIFYGAGYVRVVFTQVPAFRGDLASAVCPTMILQPLQQGACENGAVTLTVDACGTPLPGYQWMRGGVPVVNGGNISGATTASLTISPATAADSAAYTCVATNICGSIVSAPSMIEVMLPVWVPLGTGTDGTVQALAILPGGDLLAAGRFINAGGTTVTRVARWNGSAWSGLGSGFNNTVNCVAVLPNGDIVAGGTFTTAGGVAANRIARWNGTAWSPLGSGLNSTVSAVAALANGDIVAGGSFNTAGGSAANQIARWNGTAWSALGSGTNNTVNALAVLGNGDIIAGGAFTSAGGVINRNFIASWNGTTWSGLGLGFSGTVRALQVLTNGDLIAGGTFTAAGGLSANNIARWNGTAWSALGSGLGSTVNSLTVLPNGDIVAGGAFTTAGGSAASRIAIWDGVSWSALGSGLTGPTVSVLALAADAEGQLFAGGAFTAAGGAAASNIANYHVGPVITGQPASQSVCGSGEATFSVAASGAPLTYQWRRGGTPLADEPGHIAGAMGPVLTITGIVADDAGTYTCAIANACGSQQSAAATLDINGPGCCPLDYNLDTVLNPDDLGDFITDYYTSPHIPGPGGYAIPCPANEVPYDVGYKAAYTVDGAGQCNAPFPDNLGDYITDYYTGC
ncbi:MAG: beta strand repeat-containing protein [Phycisphaerales bacterium]